MDMIIEKLAEYGIPGLAIGYLMLSNYRKDQRIETLTDKQFEKNSSDAERFAGVTLAMERVLIAVQGISK